MDLALKGKTVLITGGSRGIGFACAEVFAQEGAHVHLVSVDPGRLQHAADILTQTYHCTVGTTATDLSDPASVAKVAADCPEPDILINNAGAIPGGDLQAVTEDRWREAWDLKVFGFINMTRDYYARFKTRGFGTIVNVIGMAGEKMDAVYIAGSTGNASLMAFTKAMGGASSADNIRVVGVNPGAILTDRIIARFRDTAEAKLGDAERWEELMKNLPLGRAGTPREVADTVAFLASDRASYISGTIVTVDCGHANRNTLF